MKTPLLIAVSLLAGAVLAQDVPMVTLVSHSEKATVEVLVDGAIFTAYRYPTDLPVLRKPILWPIITANGATVTRGYPLDPRPGERVDHPHQVGLWFNYGDVNGLDFWNNSDAIPAERADAMGTIVHREIVSMKNGQGTAELVTASDWVDHSGNVLLKEETRYVFHATGDRRAIDRLTTLIAVDRPVSFKDNKEGVLGIRVARALEHPASDKPEVFRDASGKATTVAVLGNQGVTGRYLSSEGREGDAVWGTRGRWVSLDGTVEGHDVTMLLLDHPQNVGFPTYWHARGYGLFAANPLGWEALSNGTEKLNFRLDKGERTTFRHRLVLLNGKKNPADLESEYLKFAGN